MTTNSSETNDETNETKNGLDSTRADWNLVNIPPEIFLQICSFLPASFIQQTLSQVCSVFQQRLDDPGWWKLRVHHQWPGKYPMIDIPDLSWVDVCVEREEIARRWRERPTRVERIHLVGHSTSVDTLHLMQDGSLLVSGGRDRSIILWKIDESLKAEEERRPILKQVLNAHQGWIWSIASRDNVICSASWDNKVTLWSMNEDMRRIIDFKCKAAALCVQFIDESLIAVGCYNKALCIFDRRAPPHPVRQLSFHRKPVLDLCHVGDALASTGEDAVVALWDIRADKPMSSLKLPQYSLCISYAEGHLVAGDKKGSIHLMDPSDGNLQLIKSFETGHERGIKNAMFSLGAIFTCSGDRSVRVFEPSERFGLLHKEQFDSEISDLDYCNSVLACSTTDHDIYILRPTAVDQSSSV